MLRKCLIGLVLAACATSSRAYYIGWEGDCLPEEGGWTRQYGDWSGIPHGTGAIRTIQDGSMTMDSLYDPGVFDIAIMHQLFDPAPGELFVMEWRLSVDQVTSSSSEYDPAVALASDDRWVIGFQYSRDTVRNPFDPGMSIVITPGEFHEYRVTSLDMRRYEFFLDGESVHEGPFSYGGDMSRAAWGDAVQGAASLHRWDYFRIYTIPEPNCLALCGASVMLLAHKRQSS